MRLLVAAVLSLMLATPAAAQWQYEDAPTPIAYVDNGPALFQFACRGGELTMGYWVRRPHETVARAGLASLAITPDPAAGSRVARGDGSSFAEDMPLIHLDGSSVIVRGPVARDWARIAQRARAEMRITFLPSGGSGLEMRDANVFGARGSNAAIAQVLGRCG
ncbi:hypothetical protein SAMN02983003_0483 [Devosia enhydra]|uniref:Invasion protein IalB, involved in pathogenesis n=1 Tax=Devosia enhydra TaxID=665118 RepID=A0A1K2HTZ1_9HYPH|nr:hypothetical protein [Devosia enhydra]SFZ81409.1 hypothetical protein SAMN02983003_0483 [Devosia enhydra]